LAVVVLIVVPNVYIVNKLLQYVNGNIAACTIGSSKHPVD